MELGQALLNFNYSFQNYGFQTLTLESDDIIIRVKMKGETPEAHAAAILAYFSFSKTDEDTFKVKYGYDLRQNFTDNYRSNDDRTAHRAVGNGYFEVRIPLTQSLVAQIESVKRPLSSNLPNANGASNVTLNDLTRPTPVPRNATPAVRNFYQEIDLFKTELMNFGFRGIQMADVRADYLKTIKFASDEFIDLVKTGK